MIFFRILQGKTFNFFVMKVGNLKIGLISLLFLISNLVYGQIVKEYSFTVPSRGEKEYTVTVPKGAKYIKAVISGQTEMVGSEIIGSDGKTVLSKNSTWSNMSNWRADLKCSASVAENDRQKPGVWKIKIIGQVHKSKAEKIKTVSGKLSITVYGDFEKTENKDYPVIVSLPIRKEYNFTVSSRGEKEYTVAVPKGAKYIKAVISGQTEMVGSEIIGSDGKTVLSKNSTWSNMSNWRADLKCSASVAENDRQKPGVWKIKIIGQVHKSKAEKIKTVSGKLTVTVN